MAELEPCSPSGNTVAPAKFTCAIHFTLHAGAGRRNPAAFGKNQDITKKNTSGFAYAPIYYAQLVVDYKRVVICVEGFCFKCDCSARRGTPELFLGEWVRDMSVP
jgi:hypothetical protein